MQVLKQLPANAAEPTWFVADAPAKRERRKIVHAKFEDCIRGIIQERGFTGI
jgi:hypothetical protein